LRKEIAIIAIAMLLGFGVVFVLTGEIQNNVNAGYGTCPSNQYATAITTTTLNCASASNSNYLTTQTSAFYSYGTCPNNQYAIAVTTTTLNCASASYSNYLTTQTSAFFNYGSCTLGQFATAITTTTLNCSTVTQFSASFVQYGFGSACKVNATGGQMLGWGGTITFTPPISIAFVTLNFQIAPPASANLYTYFEFYYGTGTAPTCGHAITGTNKGLQYQQGQAGVSTVADVETLSVVLTSLSPNTAYWVDLAAFSSTIINWVYSQPQLSVAY
jgi:hypothetical protein